MSISLVTIKFYNPESRFNIENISTVDALISEIRDTVTEFENASSVFIEAGNNASASTFSRLFETLQRLVRHFIAERQFSKESIVQYCAVLEDLEKVARNVMGSPDSTIKQIRQLMHLPGKEILTKHTRSYNQEPMSDDFEAIRESANDSESDRTAGTFFGFINTAKTRIANDKKNYESVAIRVLSHAMYPVFRESMFIVDPEVVYQNEEIFKTNFRNYVLSFYENALLDFNGPTKLPFTNPIRDLWDRCMSEADNLIKMSNDPSLTQEEKNEIISKTIASICESSERDLKAVAQDIRKQVETEIVDEHKRNQLLQDQVNELHQDVVDKTTPEDDASDDNPNEVVNDEASDDAGSDVEETPSVQMLVNQSLHLDMIALTMSATNVGLSEAVDTTIENYCSAESLNQKVAYSRFLQKKFKNTAADYKMVAESKEHVKTDAEYRKRADSIAKAREKEGRNFDKHGGRDGFIKVMMKALRKSDFERGSKIKKESTVVVPRYQTETTPPDKTIQKWIVENTEFYRKRYGADYKRVLNYRAWQNYRRENPDTCDTPKAFESRAKYIPTAMSLIGKKVENLSESLFVIVGGAVSRSSYEANRDNLNMWDRLAESTGEPVDKILLDTIALETYLLVLDRFKLIDLNSKLLTYLKTATTN